MEETDINYTMIQMVEGEPEKEGHELEEPFDEEFWLKVSRWVTWWKRQLWNQLFAVLFQIALGDENVSSMQYKTAQMS